jgi:capsular polysaccharide biosynthesis protein
MQRVIWRHRWLLIVLVLVPMAVIIPLRERMSVTYAATATIQAQATSPDADTQVQAILARVSAVATNPELVASAIQAAHVGRNADEVAAREIAARSVGSSAVVSLTVTDPDPQVAVRLAASLAHGVVRQLNELSSSYTAELATLNAQNAALTGQRNSLLSQLGSGASGQASSAVTQADLESLTAIDNQLVANAQAQQQIEIALGSVASAQVVSVPTTATGVSREVAVYGALAGLLGLILGLLIATIRELARPTMGRPDAGARELGLSLLGNVQVSDGRVTALDPDLPTRLDLAARRLVAQTLVLCGPVPPAELAALAEQLNDALLRIPASPGSGRANGSGSPSLALTDYIQDGNDHRTVSGDSARAPGAVGTITTYPSVSARSTCTAASLADLMLGACPEDPALVIVLPRFAPHAALDRAADLGVTAGWPIVGVVGMHRRRGRTWLPRREASRPPAGARAQQPETVVDAADATSVATPAPSSGHGSD